jgi:Tfp pilus assembly protein PilZ
VPSNKRKERRVSRRHRRRLQVRLWSDDAEGTGFTVDVSNTGLLIETPKTFDVGERLHLEICIGESSYFSECVVVRKKSYPPHARALFKPAIGVRLVGLIEALRDSAEAAEEVPDGPMQVDLSDPEELKAAFERDIKHGGLLVRTRESPEIDSEVVVPLRLPEPHGSIHCRGTVVKVNEDPPSVAIRLSEVKPVRDRLMEIIAEQT